MTPEDGESRINRGLGFLGHELGALLAVLISETEFIGFEALRALQGPGDEEAHRAAALEIKRRMARLGVQRVAIGRLIDVFGLLDTSRAGSLHLHLQDVPATSLVEAVVNASADRRSVLAPNSIARMNIVCDRDYMTTALRCLLDAPPAMWRGRRRNPGRTSLRFDRQQKGTSITVMFPSSLAPDPSDIRIELARQIAGLHEGNLSSDGELVWTLFVPSHLIPGRHLVGQGSRRPADWSEGSAEPS